MKQPINECLSEATSNRFSLIPTDWAKTIAISTNVRPYRDGLIYLIDQDQLLFEKPEDVCTSSEWESDNPTPDDEQSWLDFPHLDNHGTVQAPITPTILEEFADLHRQSQAEILSFARKYGALGVCKHGLPGIHNDCPPIAIEFRRRRRKGAIFACLEPWQAWKDFSKTFSLILQLTREYRDKSPIKQRACYELQSSKLFAFHALYFIPPDNPEMIVSRRHTNKVKVLVEQCLKSLMNLARLLPTISLDHRGLMLDAPPYDIRPHVLPEEQSLAVVDQSSGLKIYTLDKKVISWWPHNSLFRILVLELITVILRSDGLVCPICAQEFTRGPKEGRREFCHTCSIRRKLERNRIYKRNNVVRKRDEKAEASAVIQSIPNSS